MSESQKQTGSAREPRVSVIIVNWNLRDEILRCLESVAGQRVDAAVDVFVVDNDSSDDSCAACEREFPDVKLIRNSSNVGFAGANNVAIKQSTADYVVILNPDTELEPGCLARLLGFMESNPRAGVAAPKILETDGSVQGSARKFPALRTAFLGRTSILRKFIGKGASARDEIPCLDHDSDAPLEVDWVSGACMMVRADAISEVGLLDETYFMYWEDTDWCFRFKNKGWRVFWVPTSQILHLSGKASAKARYATILAFHKSVNYYFAKNINTRNSLFISALIRCLVSARCLLKIASAWAAGVLKRGE